MPVADTKGLRLACIIGTCALQHCSSLIYPQPGPQHAFQPAPYYSCLHRGQPRLRCHWHEQQVQSWLLWRPSLRSAGLPMYVHVHHYTSPQSLTFISSPQMWTTTILMIIYIILWDIMRLKPTSPNHCAVYTAAFWAPPSLATTSAPRRRAKRVVVTYTSKSLLEDNLFATLCTIADITLTATIGCTALKPIPADLRVALDSRRGRGA
jgi:hypothetical protein